MRQLIYDMVENKNENLSVRAYNLLMLLTIAASIMPLMIKHHSDLFLTVDYITTIIFCVDYLLRLITADIKLKRGKLSFWLYPLTPLALIDLCSILPTFLLLNNSLKLLKVVRMGRLLRVFKVVRYSKNIRILTTVIKKQKEALLLVAGLALGYIVFTALLIFNVEPETFPTFFDALYWATISLTTVGYGDIFAVSALGKIITMISSLFGLAIVALPSGIITAGYMREISKEDDD